MIKITFKNLEKSQLACDIVTEKFETLVKKFPDLSMHKIEVFLYMDNSFFKVGRDVFGVKVVITGKKYGGIVVEKRNMSLYIALDDLVLVMLGSLNRKGDRVRVKERTLSRKQKTMLAV